ncbi:MAG: trypsin-like peptidase domain-containing protein [Pirellulales bacterium]|nr:trypsin-like peptidase domain-containing protein [Pirellulales bacterium]
MKKTLILCFVSVMLGAAVTATWRGPIQTLPAAVAQDVAVPAAPSRAAATAQPLGEDLLTPEERVNVAVYENVNRSVVNITTRTIHEGRMFLFDMPEGRGEGSGIVIDRKGRILTNFHVIDGARDVQVTLFDGKTHEAKLVGIDPPTDVAVIQIDAPAESLFPVTFGNSTGLRVGQRVFAIGNPFGFERTLTTGIISSLNRSIPARRGDRKIKSLIQIDAAINPGNSGGPLLDSRGRMIGMNTAIASRTGESAGVGFAIPVNTIGRVMPQLIEHGRVVRADIGILTVYQMRQGLLVKDLEPGGPAEQAGLRGPQVVRRRKQQGPIVYEYQTLDRSAADLIVAIDGQKIADADELLTQVESKQPGDEVVLTIIRGGREMKVPVRLSADEE